MDEEEEKRLAIAGYPVVELKTLKARFKAYRALLKAEYTPKQASEIVTILREKIYE